MKKFCSWWANIYMLAVLIVLPLYMENQYFNIVEAKSHCFTAIHLVMLPIGIAFLAVSLFKAGHTGRRNSLIKLNIMDIAIVSFAAVSFISSVLSEDFTASFWGTKGWGAGSFAWICVSVSYLLLSRFLKYNQKIWLPVILVNIFIISVAVLQAAGTDVFAMHANMFPEQVYLYFSSIGNNTWWTGYLCLLVPMTAVFILQSGKKSDGLKPETVLYMVFWAFLCFAILICSSDSLIAGFGLCAFFAVPLAFKSGKNIQMTGWMITIFGAAIMIYSFLPCFTERINASESDIISKLIKPWPGIIIMTFGLLCIFITVKFNDAVNNRNIRRAGTVICEIILSILAGAFFYRAIMGFHESWGSGRGKIWSDSFALFHQYPLKSKLIGIGPEMLRVGYSGTSGWFGQTVLVAHSEPVQYMLTMGIVGVCLWFGIWGAVVFCHRNILKTDNIRYAFFLPLLAFFGQSFFNSIMTQNLALLFLFFALARKRIEE